MGLWAKSIVIFNAIRDHGKQSLRSLAERTGLSKSSVHRHRQAMDRRDRYPESSFWETEAGRAWLIRLVVATLLVFGLKRGVGAETLSEFFGRLRLEAHVGCSPSALRCVMHTLERLLLETAGAWEKEGIAHGEIRPVIGAVDETFLQRMMLVFMDLATGYLLMEEVSADRSFATWFDRANKRLTTFGTEVLYLVSDRAKALAEAHTLVEQHDGRWWEAEVCRLRGVLLLRQPGTPQAEAETWLQRALDIARRQEAKSLELRAAMSLSRLWQQQGKQAEAHALLAPIYGWFTEGFDTADLQDTRALLEALT